MKKVLALAAMLAMMMMAAAPAFADTVDFGDDNSTSFDNSFNTVVFGNQAQILVGDQVQGGGDSLAAADDGSTATATTDQSLEVSQSQSLSVFSSNSDLDGDGILDVFEF